MFLKTNIKIQVLRCLNRVHSTLYRVRYMQVFMHFLYSEKTWRYLVLVQIYQYTSEIIFICLIECSIIVLLKDIFSILLEYVNLCRGFAIFHFLRKNEVLARNEKRKNKLGWLVVMYYKNVTFEVFCWNISSSKILHVSENMNRQTVYRIKLNVACCSFYTAKFVQIVKHEM